MKPIKIILAIALGMSLLLNIYFAVRINNITSSINNANPGIVENESSLNPFVNLDNFENEVGRLLLFEDFFEVSSPSTDDIGVDSARIFSQNYANKLSHSTIKDSTRAVWFSIPKIISAIMTQNNLPRIQNPKVELANAGIYIYLGKYGPNDKYPYQTTFIIQPGLNDKLVSKDFVYNFGDLCPKNCPDDKYIIE